jgi:uncharacterized protein (DUF58 family)
VGHLTRGGGNRIGAIVASGSQLARVPARGGRPHLEYLLRTLANNPRATPGDRGDLATALEQLRRPPRRRGLVVVISDFIGPVDWERPLRGLSARHDLLAVEVIDPRDLDLPAVGLVTLVDPETGRSKEVSTSAGLRAAFAKASAEHRAQVAGALRRAGAAQLVLRTDGDWIADVLRFIVGRKRGWTGATAPGTPNRTPRGGEAWQ